MIGSFKVIGVFLADIQNIYYQEYLDALNQYAEREHFRMIVYSAMTEGKDGTNYENNLYAAAHLIQFDVIDALVIMTASFSNEDLTRYLIKRCNASGIVAVTTDSVMEDCYCIINSLEPAFNKMMRHVISKHGCSQVAFLGGNHEDEYSDERRVMFEAAMKENGLTPNEDLILYGMYSPEVITAQVGKLIKNGTFPEAFVCANDKLANMLIDQLREFGYNCPRDVIVVGVDGIRSEQYHMPKLTTSRLRLETDAMECIHLLKDVCSGRASERTHQIEHELVIAESCGCFAPDPYAYGAHMENLYRTLKNTRMKTSLVYQILTEATKRSSLEEMQPEMERFMKPASIVCLNKTEDGITSVKEQISMEQNPYSENILEYCGKDKNGNSFGNRELSYKEWEERYCAMVQLKGASVMMPLIFNNRLYGFFAEHSIKDFSDSDGLARRIRYFAHAFAILEK